MRESRTRLSLIVRREKDYIEKAFDTLLSETLDSDIHRPSADTDSHFHIGTCINVIELQLIQLGEFQANRVHRVRKF
jgi:hypothetical protein